MVDSLHEIEKSIGGKGPAPVYLFWGQENWSKKRCFNLLKEALVPEGMESFNFERFDAGDTATVQIVDSALTLPMMGGQKFIWVDNCQKWDVSQRKPLSGYFKDPSVETCLVLDFDLEKMGKLSSFVKSAGSNVRVLEFKKPTPWNLDSYVQKLAKACDITLDKPSRDLLADFCGDDLELMKREIEKLQLLKADDNRILAEDVAALTGRTRPVSRYELQKWVGNRELAKALIKTQEILDSGDNPIGVLSMLARYTSQLLLTKSILAQGTRDPQMIGRQVGLPPNIAKGLIQEQAAFSATELKTALGDIAAVDDQLKSFRIEGRALLDRLLSAMLSKGTWSPNLKQSRR